MKKLYRLTILLLFVAFALTAVMLLFAPDTVPMHYNAAGEVDRYGSKYENFIFPGINALAGGILLLVAKKQKESGNERVLVITAFFTTLTLSVMSLCLVYKSMTYRGEATVNYDPVRVTGIFLGLFLIIMGNFLPKARRNSYFGLRTKWSLSGEEVWRKSQRFAGIASVVAGLGILLLCSILERRAAFMALMVVYLLWTLVCIYASYRIYKAENKE